MRKYYFKTLIFILFILTGCEKSKDKEINDIILSEINNFYFTYKSIDFNLKENSSIPIQRDEKSKLMFIKFNRIALGLDEKWIYADQNIELATLPSNKTIFEITTYFKKENSIAIRNETFYYDINDDDIFISFPIPIEDIGKILEEETTKVLYSRQLWKGDFKDFLLD